ncbi:hypothetical protein E4U13_004546 [Claviceps humidiphila]|uniref:non-specific serine/threonine protein kinase n=1 Tax=Claviceps humidiphila TaxID=1294629 RepID=A0A9P7TT08_9HYPO|nr:hypothetical protein E4U13_004546 [Claviceps humidiphila]
MAASPFRRSWKSLFSRTWKPLAFPSKGFPVIPTDEKIEEETLPNYVASRFYPVKIGEIFRARYQVVGKLGYGVTSTVWLARDFNERRYVALKLYNTSEFSKFALENELDAYRRIENSAIEHPGRRAIRSLLDTFAIDGPDGQHRCLVHPPLWDSVYGFRRRNPVGKLPEPIMALVLKPLFHALDFLHQECHIAHTDIKEGNLLFGADESVLKAFEKEELEKPCPRKEANGRTIYLSRELGIPEEFGEPMLCDFGAAMRLQDGFKRREKIQPNQYRAPEVLLDTPWTSSADIWNVGCMIWDSFQGGNLFTGRDPETGTYQSRAHLAEMIALLGPPPPYLLAQANLRSKFFSDEGIPIPESRPLEQRESVLEGEDRACFLRFMRKMLQWDPEKRSSAKELAEDEWILKHY